MYQTSYTLNFYVYNYSGSSKNYMFVFFPFVVKLGK